MTFIYIFQGLNRVDLIIKALWNEMFSFLIEKTVFLIVLFEYVMCRLFGIFGNCYW